MTNRNIRVIFDTNVWISFLIGKRLTKIKQYIINRNITIVVTDQLLTELKIVTSREKLKKYFPKDSVTDLIELLEAIAENIKIEPIHFIKETQRIIFFWI
jgi:putative PIN family toxin of toxin-antitoxin system